jgi:hypothetical protein
MADEATRSSQYEYKLNSNLVINRQRDEPLVFNIDFATEQGKPRL